MANCNECKKLEVKVKNTDDGKYMDHICKKHKVTVRYTPKVVKGFIWPCTECNGEDFIKK